MWENVSALISSQECEISLFLTFVLNMNNTTEQKTTLKKYCATWHFKDSKYVNSDRLICNNCELSR